MLFFYRKIFILLAVISAICFSQQTDESQFQEGMRLYKANRLNDAAKVFKNYYDDYSEDKRIPGILGQIEVERQNWKNAIHWFEIVLEDGLQDVLANYYLGICYREQGKTKAFIMRTKDWNKSEKYFKTVLENAEDFRDVYFQFAMLQSYRKEYADAVIYAEKQIELNDDVKSYVAAYRYYESFLYNDGTSRFREWALKRSGDRNKFYIGESFRLDGGFAVADSIFAVIINDKNQNISLVPVYLAFSKSKAQQQNDQACQYYYEQALDCVNNQVDAALLFENVKYILSDEELLEYLNLKQLGDVKSYFKKLWVSRDPMPASTTNFRMIEHVKRFIFAEQNYYYDGFRLQFNNPDRLHYLIFPRVFDLNDKFNDKGLIYIRHGEADDRAFEVGPELPLNESWLYYPRGQLQQKLMYHFIQGETQTGNNWRLVAYLPRYLVESRVHWDTKYARMWMGDAIEAITLEREMAIQGREDVKIGLNTDRHSWEKNTNSIFFPFYLATFRGENNTTDCEVYYSINTSDVLPQKTNVTLNDSVSIAFAAFDLDYNELDRIQKYVKVRDIKTSTDSLGYWPDRFVYEGDQERYQFSISIRTPGDESLGGYKFKFFASSYDGPDVKMSGIELAHLIYKADEKSPFLRNGFNIIPNPPKIFARKSPINIYFELYNLPVSEEKAASFAVEYKVKLLEERQKNVFQKMAGIFKNRQPLTSNKFDRYSKEERSIEYLALDLSKNDPGLYELEVVALLPSLEDTVSRKINFELK